MNRDLLLDPLFDIQHYCDNLYNENLELKEELLRMNNLNKQLVEECQNFEENIRKANLIMEYTCMADLDTYEKFCERFEEIENALEGKCI